MSAPPARHSPATPASSASLARTVLGWAALAVVAVVLFLLVRDLGSRVRSPSFAILRIADGWRYALIGLGAIVSVLLATAYIGKLWGQRTRPGRRIAYGAVLTDQLTHLVFWIVILFALYPIFYVASASFDPLNRLASASLGSSSDPLLIRARVVPSFDRADLTNYAALFQGVIIRSWQWLLLALSGLGVLGLGGLWFAVQASGGIATPTLRRARTYATWLAILGIAAFFMLLAPEQFTGNRNSSRFLLWIRNTFLISGLTGMFAVLLTTTAGYAMARLRFPGRFQALMFFIFIQMFPGFLGLIAIYSLMRALDLTNTFTGLILAYSGGAIAFGTWIYKGYVESLPASLEEAALVDGATRWVAFVKIVLPLSGPMLVFIFLLQFIGTYTEFLLANILLTGSQNWNVGVGLRSFATSAFSTEYGVFSAAAVLGSLPIVALFYSFQQVFVSGNVAGGVKE